MQDANAWRHVDTILEKSADPIVRFYGLQILEYAIKYRWGTLPTEQREGIRNYIVTKIIAVRSCTARRGFDCQRSRCATAMCTVVER